jgi:hypothetical protein
MLTRVNSTFGWSGLQSGVGSQAPDSEWKGP